MNRNFYLEKNAMLWNDRATQMVELGQNVSDVMRTHRRCLMLSSLQPLATCNVSPSAHTASIVSPTLMLFVYRYTTQSGRAPAAADRAGVISWRWKVVREAATGVVDKCVRQSDRWRWTSDPRRHDDNTVGRTCQRRDVARIDRVCDRVRGSLVKLSGGQWDRYDRRLTVNEDAGRPPRNNDLIDLRCATCHSTKDLLLCRNNAACQRSNWFEWLSKSASFL